MLLEALFSAALVLSKLYLTLFIHSSSHIESLLYIRSVNQLSSTHWYQSISGKEPSENAQTQQCAQHPLGHAHLHSL